MLTRFARRNLEREQSLRAIIQRVSQARVLIAGERVGEIRGGLCVLVGFGHMDGERQAEKLAKKIVNLRVFDDAGGKMNLSALDVKGHILAVSQFTLYGDCTRGHRPSFSAAAPSVRAEHLYDYFIECLKASGLNVQTGRFRAAMDVCLTNSGPVTFFLEEQ